MSHNVVEAYGACKQCKTYTELVGSENGKSWACPRCQSVVIYRGDRLNYRAKLVTFPYPGWSPVLDK